MKPDELRALAEWTLNLHTKPISIPPADVQDALARAVLAALDIAIADCGCEEICNDHNDIDLDMAHAASAK